MTVLDQVVDAFRASATSSGLEEVLAGEEPERLGRVLADALAARVEWDRHVGRLLEVDEARRRLGVKSRQAVYQRLRRGTLLGWEDSGRLVFPEFQFRARGGIYPGLTDALRVLKAASMRPKTLASWFHSPQPELDGETPLGWLRQGKSREVLLRAARQTTGALAH